MIALPHFDTYIQAPYADAEDAPDDDAIIDDMVAEPDCIDEWLTGRVPCPSSVASLLSLILDHGMPRMNESKSDDALRDMYDERIQAVRNDFTAWALQPQRFRAAPVDAWRNCP